MHYKKLIIPPLIVMITFLSWINPSIRLFWDIIDQKVFDFLNPWIQTNPFWQNFWAFTGHRIMDWIHDIIMIGFFLFSIKTAHPSLKRTKIAEFIFCMLFLILVISVVNGIIFPEFIKISRKSPTLVNQEAFRLSSIIEWIKVKDHSRKSFPGDHATTAILFACLIFHLMRWKIGLLAFIYAIFFCLPRLVVGAHWFTDNLIGSASIAIITSSLAFGTPFASKCIQFIQTIIWRKKSCPKSIKSTKSY